MAGPNPTRDAFLRIVNAVGRFDISGDHVAVGQTTHDAASDVFLTVIQRDGSFKPVNKL
jgi:hypothetical protein